MAILAGTDEEVEAVRNNRELRVIVLAAIEEGARREEEEKLAAFLAEQERRRQAAEERNAAILWDMLKALDLDKTEREEQMEKKARETAAQKSEAELRRKYG